MSSASPGSLTRLRIKFRSLGCSRSIASEIRCSCSAVIHSTLSVSFIYLCRRMGRSNIVRKLTILTMKIALLVLLAVVTVPAIFAADEPFAPLPTVDLSKLNPSDFTDAEIDLPFYLNNFHQVADSVVATGADRGFIAISVWRSPKDNHSYNARIMENILSLRISFPTRGPGTPTYARHPCVSGWKRHSTSGVTFRVPKASSANMACSNGTSRLRPLPLSSWVRPSPC